MGWVFNNEKERVKNNLTPAIISRITNITAVSYEVQELVAGINYLIDGVPSGTDSRLNGCCQRILGNLSRSNELLRLGIENTKQLRTMDWTSNGD